MLSQLTYNLAYQIATNRAALEAFIANANNNEWIDLIHANHYYSYPEWQKRWLNTKQDCCYHKINTCCNCCGKEASRNYAGIGGLYAYKSATIKKNRLTLYCRSCRDWRDSKEFRKLNLIKSIDTPNIIPSSNQLTLF